LREYRAAWVVSDCIAGVTLAAYAIPVSLAYSGLAGLPPQVGIYGYMLGGLGYALLGSSRQLAVGPTSAISLMIAGTVGAMAGGDAVRYAQIASLAGFTVALLCLIAWAMRLSVLVRLISNSILVGFKAGAGLTIAMTQLPSLIGVPGGGHDVIERAVSLAGQVSDVNQSVLVISLIAIALLLLGDRMFPARPIALGVVVLSILAAYLLGLSKMGVPTTGHVPAGLPALGLPTLRLRDIDGIVPLAAGCLLLAYIEGVSAASAFASKHGYAMDPRQELLGIGAANFAAALAHGYPVAGGLSQSAVNEKAGARSPLALVFASAALAVCLLFLTEALEHLPKAVLAAVVLVAIVGLFDFPAMAHMWRASRIDFYAAAAALVGVLLMGILQGILFAVLASVLMLLARVSYPHVAFLGRIPNTSAYSDLIRHPENEPIQGMLVFRPESSVLYVNTDAILAMVMSRLGAFQHCDVRMVVCDLSSAPFVDLAGSQMLHTLHATLANRGIALRIVGAHGRIRDLLRVDGLTAKIGDLDRTVTLDDLVREQCR